MSFFALVNLNRYSISIEPCVKGRRDQ